MPRPKGFAFVRKTLMSPLWHVTPLEYAHATEAGDLFLTLCGMTFAPEAFSHFVRYAASTGLCCLRCRSEYNLALDTVERMLAEQQATITLKKEDYRWLQT